MALSLIDGLGNDEVVQSGANLNTQHQYLVGSLTVANKVNALVGINVTGSITSSTNIATSTNVTATGSFVGSDAYTALSLIQPGNLSGEGIIINNIPCETNISGGMWVVGSAASGTTPAYVLKAAAASTCFPLGICLATTASGTSNKPEVLVKGLYKGIVAEGTISVGDQVKMGAGAGLNCALKQTAGSDARGVCVMAGGSEATISVYLF